jgi:hypothetical protein
MSSSDFRDNDARVEAAESAAIDEQVPGRDPGPIDEDAVREADRLEVDPEVAENYQEQMERSTEVKGEGQIP